MRCSAILQMFMFYSNWILFAIIAAGILLSILFKKLTTPAAFTGGILSFLIYLGSGFGGVTAMAAFFVIGVLATSWKLKEKQKAGLAETEKGKRHAGQVFANAGMAAIIGLIAYNYPTFKMDAFLIIAACFASATADTVSSELGNIYGKRFYNILSCKKSIKGLNGVISFEGTLFGLAGSMVIALVYYLFEPSFFNVFILLIAGNAGNIADSVLGASLENRGYLSNNVVNFLNTVVAAIIAWLLMAV